MSLEVNLTKSFVVIIPTNVPLGAVIELNPTEPPLAVIVRGLANLCLVDNYKLALNVEIPVVVPW